MENEMILGKRIYRHPSLMIVNSGDHWVVANIISYSGKEITIWDPYPEDVEIESVTRLVSVLQNMGWHVRRIGIGTQQNKDKNTCGYNVLMFVKQLLSRKSIEEGWKPIRFDLKKWVEQVYKDLDYKIGEQKIRGTTGKRKAYNKKKIGSAYFRRERYRHWVSAIAMQSQETSNRIFRENHVQSVKQTLEKVQVEKKIWDAKERLHRIFSHNMNLGMGNPHKLRNILKYFVDMNPMAIMLQEIGVNMQDMEEETYKRIIDQELPGYTMWASV
ncbi:MAG: hypothetical protein GY737_12190, partial [Desulfobacteraceae bacterium]|nr:hypothetical protein [Desulfobacteraceae bacterium]